MKLKVLLKTVQDAVVKAEACQSREEVLEVLKQVNSLLVELFKDFQIVKRPKK